MASPTSKEALMDSIRSHGHHESLFFSEAVAVTLLLSDWDKFGLSERVCYHFDLIETLAAPSSKEGAEINAQEHADSIERNMSPPEDGVCGVVSLLECVPKMAKYRRKDLRSHIRSFNIHAQEVKNEAKVACYEPPRLPLRLSPATRVSFAYEVTKVAFCLDASPTLVSTFGHDENACCALDRLGSMTRTFFKALIKPITAPWLADPNGWRPVVAVTVLAVYPNSAGASDTSLLVRDFRVYDIASAERLSKEISNWALKEVESEIASRMGHTRTGGYDSWSIPTPSSSLRDMFDAGDVALSLLPSHARPCIVVATDCRSVACESIMDIFNHPERVDTPLVVLDMSSSDSHAQVSQEIQVGNEPSFLSYDPGSASNFPLLLSDDSEVIFGICRATGGAFFDAELLKEAAHTVAGKVPENSPIAADSYFAFKRRALRPNAVQWYTLFSFSPLSPSLHPAWGKLVPPTYIQKRLGMYVGKQEVPPLEGTTDPLLALPSFRRLESASSRPGSRKGSWQLEHRNVPAENPLQKRQTERVVFSMYVVSPVRVKGLLLMRIKEGYRAKQYGQSTQDPDKVSIQFTLPLELGTVLHYELSYKALLEQSPLVGVANVKIELSGERTFVQAVKNDFISNLTHVPRGRPSTIAMKASARLCKVFRGLRKEDCLQAYLCPLSWTDRLSTSDTPFARRLGTLSRVQRRKHFRLDEFDVVCVGLMPYDFEDNLLLSEFIDFDSGEQELFDALSEWSTQTIKEKERYVKKASCSRDDLDAYCVIEVTRSGSTSRIFTLTIETFGGSNAADRLVLLSSLKRSISENKDVLVLQKPMDEFLVGLRDPLRPELQLLRKQRFLESHFHHETWNGGNNPELLALLTKRRNEVGMFWFLHSSDTYSLFAKLVTDDNGKLVTADYTKSSDSASSELYQVQYQIAVISGSVVIDMHVEREQGVFFTQSMQTTRFSELFERVRVRDQECGRALGSRTSLLSLLNSDASVLARTADDQRVNVERLLRYASRVSRKMRFFHSGAGSANQILEELTIELMISDSFGPRVKRLTLDADFVSDVGNGIWFLIQFDANTMSMAHLASSERQEIATTDEPSFVYRELTFFTIGISDLYCKRDLIADDDSIDDHISEYMCVSEFADEIEALQGMNYARAAYFALRMDARTQKLSFDRVDFAFGLSFCSFFEVKSITISQEIRHAQISGGDSNLSRAISSLLSPVPGDSFCFVYHGDEGRAVADVITEESDVEGFDNDEERSTSNEDAQAGHSDDDVGETSSAFNESDDESSHGFSLSSDASEVPEGSLYISPPIFVRFSLDGELVALDEIAKVNRTSTLTASISIFDPKGTLTNKHFEALSPSHFPGPQYAVALRIRSLLDSYVAEQLLERFRAYGPSVSRSDLKVVRQCLQKARHVLSRDIEIQFFDSKKDSMIRAAAPSGGDAEIENAFPLLYAQLEEDDSILLKPTSSTGFFVNDTVDESNILRFWCFVTLKMQRGVVSIRLYHPDGEDRAREALSFVQKHVEQAIHHVNQVLLLRSLHRNRIASSFLIPGDVDLDEWNSDDDMTEDRRETASATDVSSPGAFSCPVKFKTSFPLYHRCVSTQVVLSLEASVLHSFAVSNRRGIFVYKDESGAIFYMTLRATVCVEDNTDGVELLVFGLHQPGPSVTHQLARLLQRRLLVLAVDTLSAVLTKNPHFNWKPADIHFLRSYEESWRSLEDDQEGPAFNHDIEYAVPGFVYDPIMLLVYFRQNICGSTFFHRLQEASPETEFTHSSSTSLQEDESSGHPAAAGDGQVITVPFDSREFALFYNNAPSPLDPEFQPVCTLTEKGAEYSRKAGTGIALIQVTLIDKDGRVVKELTVGQAPNESESMPAFDAGSLRLKKVEVGSADGKLSDFFIRVSITDTVLDREALHSWVELTLNQVLVAWIIERHIQRAQLGLLRHNTSTVVRNEPQTFSSENERKHIANDMVPGFPHLVDLLNASHDLPHPAIEKLKLEGVIKASSVATVALGLLEKCLNALLRKETKHCASNISGLSGTVVIRSARDQRPKIVNLSWDSQGEAARVTESKSGISSTAQDSPIECPEYICFYGCNCYSDGESKDAALSPSAMCFREVMIEDDSSENPFTEALLTLRQKNPLAFSRSLAFVLSVKRNRRSLLTYNWNPQVYKSLIGTLREANIAHLNVLDASMHLLQRRSLQALAPPATKQSQPATRAKEKCERRSSVKKVEKEQHLTEKEPVPKTRPIDETDQPVKTPTRRIQRPTLIRRPKLVGKSVEGAAVQAMAASRARASANRFNPVGSSPLQKTTQKTAPSRTTRPGDRVAHRSASSSSPTVANSVETDNHAPEKPSNREAASVPAFSLILKEYATMMSTTLASPLQQSRMIQTLINKWWFDNPERPVHPVIRDFLLSRSVFMWSNSFELLGFPDRMAKYVSGYFAQWLKMTNPEFDILHLDTPSRDDSLVSPASTIVVELKRFNDLKLCIALQISLIYQTGDRSPMLRCKAWMIMLPSNDIKEKPAKKTRRKSLNSFEREAALMDKKTCRFEPTVNLDSQVFNFSAFLLERSLQPWKESLFHDEMLPLVQDMMKRIPLERQLKMEGMQYMVFEAPIILSSYQNKFIDLYSSNALFDHLLSNASSHDIIICGSDGVRFNQLIAMHGTASLCFMTRDLHVTGRLQLIILCRTEGRRLNEYVFRRGSPIGVKLLDLVAAGAATVARDVLQAAAIDMRLDALWAMFTPQLGAKRFPSREDFQELRQMVESGPLIGVEENLQSVLFDRDKEYKVNWSECCMAMEEDPLFFPHFAFHEGDSTQKLFYMRQFDEFLSLLIGENGILEDAQLLWRDRSHENEESKILAGQAFANYLMHYLWHNL